MSDYDEILQQIPMDQLASMLGVDEQTASAATQEAFRLSSAGCRPMRRTRTAPVSGVRAGRARRPARRWP